MMGQNAATARGITVADKDKGKLTCITVEVAKNGYEIRASYEPKKSLSQKKGWIPSPYVEPDKCVATSKADLLKQLSELVPETKEKK
jgi:hypothetical protein